MFAGFGIMELQRVLASLRNAVITPKANDVMAMEDKVSGPAWFCLFFFRFCSTPSSPFWLSMDALPVLQVTEHKGFLA
jgi:hypothetical protein